MNFSKKLCVMLSLAIFFGLACNKQNPENPSKTTSAQYKSVPNSKAAELSQIGQTASGTKEEPKTGGQERLGTNSQIKGAPNQSAKNPEDSVIREPKEVASIKSVQANDGKLVPALLVLSLSALTAIVALLVWARKDFLDLRTRSKNADNSTNKMGEEIRHLAETVRRVELTLSTQTPLPGGAEGNGESQRVAYLQSRLEHANSEAQSAKTQASQHLLRVSELEQKFVAAERKLKITNAVADIPEECIKGDLPTTIEALERFANSVNSVNPSSSSWEDNAHRRVLVALTKEARELKKILSALPSAAMLDIAQGDLDPLINPRRGIPLWLLNDPVILGAVTLLESCRAKVLWTVCQQRSTEPIIPDQGDLFEFENHVERRRFPTSNPNLAGKVESCLRMGFRGQVKAEVVIYELVGQPQPEQLSVHHQPETLTIPESIKEEAVIHQDDTSNETESPEEVKDPIVRSTLDDIH